MLHRSMLQQTKKYSIPLIRWIKSKPKLLERSTVADMGKGNVFIDFPIKTFALSRVFFIPNGEANLLSC